MFAEPRVAEALIWLVQMTRGSPFARCWSTAPVFQVVAYAIRQEARRAALDAQSRRRRERAEREKRLEDLAVRVLVAIRERDAAVADADRRAGEALCEMLEEQGLSVREAVEWCGDEITTREATRLRRLAEDSEVGERKVDFMDGVAGMAEGLARGAAREDVRVPITWYAELLTRV